MFLKIVTKYDQTEQIINEKSEVQTFHNKILVENIFPFCLHSGKNLLAKCIKVFFNGKKCALAPVHNFRSTII